MTPASERFKTSIIPGSARKAEMSLTISAPAARAWRAVSALYVSIDRNRSGNRLRRRFMTGMTRRSSSFAGTGSDPGRDDSPPTSRMMAPSLTIRSACRNAASSSMNRPPSEKESGVTFKTPIISPDRLRSTERFRSFQIMRHTHCVRHRLASSFACPVWGSSAKHADRERDAHGAVSRQSKTQGVGTRSRAIRRRCACGRDSHRGREGQKGGHEGNIPKESETSFRHFICSWVKTNNPVSEKKESSYEDYKAFSKKFCTLDYSRGVDFRHRVFFGTCQQTD